MKTEIRWSCDTCHQSCITVASRNEDTPDVEPVLARVKCPICGGVSTKSFRPGTDPNTAESYAIEEWVNRLRYRKTELLAEGRQAVQPPVPDEEDPGPLTDKDLDEIEAKVRQCQPPHLASTWTLVPPVNEWYARDVPRLLAELRELRRLADRRKVRRR
ncbi:MAG TPA: hypothetical protein VGL15_14990 [Vicinamibacteria bacterium]|jgi:hypothetical protein